MSDELLGPALALACKDAGVLARIGGALGEAARAFAQTDRAGADGRQKRAELLAAVRAPVPPGLRGVHPSWLEAALADLPARARAALADDPQGAVEVWLVRRACAGIPPLRSTDPAIVRPRVPADVARMTGASLRAWFEEVGKDQLAFALGDHARALPALAAAIARIDQPPRAGELGPRRAAVARAQAQGGREPVIVGARAIAPHLPPAIARASVLRLPAPDGEAISTELTLHRAGQTATWNALIAPA